MTGVNQVARKNEPQTGTSPSREKRLDGLRLLGFSESLATLIRFFAVHPSQRWRFREIQQRLNPGSASLQLNLARLVDLGVARREVHQSSVSYSIVQESRVWWSLTRLVGELCEPETLIKEAVKDVPGISAAFIFGSVAAGTATSESDIDLFVVGDNFDRNTFYRNVAEAQQLSGKAINTVAYSTEQFASRLGARTGFIREVLLGKKIWVGGDALQIAPLATAAGLPADWASSVREVEGETSVP